jgi:HK97 family phage portal protein
MFIDPRINKAQYVPQVKSTIAPVNLSFANFLLDGGNSDLAHYESIRLYTEAMPFYHAVDNRATAFSDIPIRVWDTKAKQFIDDHESLELLDNPNADVTGKEFLYQVSSFLDITGNSFMIATGQITKPPLELLTVSPTRITFSLGNKFGLLHVPNSIWVTESNIGQKTFTAEEDRQRDIIRFIRDQDKELWHVRQFNPYRSTSNFWGMSRANSLWLELQQYIAGNINNLSILKRGTRLSMAWTNTTGVELTETQWQRMQEEKQKYEGDKNAGGTPILDGMDVTSIQQSNRDMEFTELQKSTVERISIIYNIPLATLTTTAMTLNNLETSQLQFYDNAVIPHANYIYSELTKFVLHRYKNSENLVYSFNETDITALNVRIIENTRRQNEIGANTIDEIRTLLGYEGLETGGDVILKPATLIPVGSDADTSDELDKPARTKYIELMQDLKNKDGSRRYTDSEIIKIMNETDVF